MPKKNYSIFKTISITIFNVILCFDGVNEEKIKFKILKNSSVHLFQSGS